MHDDDATRVVGVYAHFGPGKVLRYENGCVVAGSVELIKQYASSLVDKPAGGMQISKLRFGEVYEALKTGAAYAFDQRSYARFYSLARRAGVDDLRGFPDGPPDQLRFMKVQFTTS